MNKRHLRNLKIVMDKAITVKPVSGSRMAAAIVYQNNMLTIGYNQTKTHPLMAYYSKNHHAVSLHAEVDAIKNALYTLNVEQLNDCTLYIARARKDPTIFTTVKGKRKDVCGEAKPCAGCMRAIVAFGIKKVIYTTDTENTYEEIIKNEFNNRNPRKKGFGKISK